MEFEPEEFDFVLGEKFQLRKNNWLGAKYE